MGNCDCPSCPCAVPVVESRRRDCPECRRGNHMDWHTAERRRSEAAAVRQQQGRE